MLGNVNSVPAERLARSMADVVLAEDLAAPSPLLETTPVPLALPPASFAGRYALGQMLLELREHDDALYFRMGGGELRRLAATGPATFATSEAGLSLEFRLDENRSITGVDLLAAGRTLAAERSASSR